MKRMLFVSAIALSLVSVSVPMSAEAHWGHYYPRYYHPYGYPYWQQQIILDVAPSASPQPQQFVILEQPVQVPVQAPQPQITVQPALPTTPQPQIIILQPPQTQEQPRVVQAPPPVPAPVPQASTPVPAPETTTTTVETKVKAAGDVQVNTTCTHCRVTNEVYADGGVKELPARSLPPREEVRKGEKPAKKPVSSPEESVKSEKPAVAEPSPSPEQKREESKPVVDAAKDGRDTSWSGRPVDDYMVIGMTALAAALVAAIIMLIIMACRQPSSHSGQLPRPIGIPSPQPWPAPGSVVTEALAAPPVGAPAGDRPSDAAVATMAVPSIYVRVEPAVIVYRPTLEKTPPAPKKSA